MARTRPSRKRIAGVALALGAGVVAVGLGGSAAAKGERAAATTTFTTVYAFHAISPGAPRNPFNPLGNAFTSFDQMVLGWSKNDPKAPNTGFVPGIAQRWKLSRGGRRVTLWIQPNARWSDGSHVTAQDVRTSIALNYIRLGSATSLTPTFNVGSIRLLGRKSLQIDQVPGTNYKLYLRTLLLFFVVPDSQYRELLPANVWQLISTAQYSGEDKARLDAAADALARLAQISRQTAAFEPEKYVAAGPFVLQRVNAGEAVLVKNRYYYAAAKIAPRQVVLRNYTGNQQIWNYLISGQLDYAPFTAMPTNIYKRILQTKGNRSVFSTNYVAAALAFNQSYAPYGMKAARQALAHVIDRGAVRRVGQPVSGTVARWTDGMVEKMAMDWLSPADRKRLNPYSYNVRKATSLLQKAGFSKVDGTWRLPNGERWEIKLHTVSGFSDWIVASSLIANMLTRFGIPTEPVLAPNYSTYLQNIAAGNYAVGWWLTALGPSTYTAFQRVYGPNNGYNLLGSRLVRYKPEDKKGNWLNSQGTVKIPKYGTVNPGKLASDLGQVRNPKTERQIVTKLALATNTQLPMLELWNYIRVNFVNTNRWTNFPVKNEAMLANQPGVWMTRGYVRPKR
ncbi:MAG: ABC transporter substrate-binding protein [Actinobacteria bacterium]|nr:ABC transporter substrate-binding protein [Actinomycetota bacterium]